MEARDDVLPARSAATERLSRLPTYLLECVVALAFFGWAQATLQPRVR